MRWCLVCVLAANLQVLTVAQAIFGVECKAGISIEKCKQVLAIAKALDKTDCESKRDFYDCMRIEGCYFAEAECRTEEGSPGNGQLSGTPISCSDACESEPFFSTCLDNTVRTTPEEDFHLCPHISKAMQSTPAPTAEEFKAAPAIPFTLSAWTSWKRADGAASVTNVLPALWSDALRKVMSDMFLLNPLAVNIEEPISHRAYLSWFPRSPEPFLEAEETTFFVFYVHVLDETLVQATRSMLEVSLVGETGILPTNISAVEKGLFTAINSSIPQGAGLILHQVQLYLISGREGRFPATTTTTTLTTTSSIDPFLVLEQWRAWRIRCSVGIVFRWEVEELDFWGDKCPWREPPGVIKLVPFNETDNVSFFNPNLTAISSGDLKMFDNTLAGGSAGVSNPCCTARKSFDGNARGDFSAGSAWVSGCMGCDPREAWIGLDGGSQARFSVACVVFQQGRDATNQCEKTIIEASNDMVTWEWRGEVAGFGEKREACVSRTQNDYPLLECGGLDDSCEGQIDFGTCPGYREVCEENRCRCAGAASRFDPRFADWDCGIGDDGCNGTLNFGTCTGVNATCQNNRCKDTSFKASMWRLLCESGTVGRWWVKDIEFHREGLCLNPIKQYRSTISSGSYSGEYPESNAFDANPDTLWMSDCQHCPSSKAWIGIDFGFQTSVSCVKLAQHESTIQQCTRLILEYSDEGDTWTERHRYGFGGYSLKAEEELVSEIDIQQNDEELFPPQRMALWWRVSCMETLDHQWGIFELDFYDDVECTNSLRRAQKSIVHSRGSSWLPENAFDYREDTLWLTGCGRCIGTDCDPCDKGKAYLGVEFQKLVIVKCVKIRQLEPDQGGCSTIRLQFSTSGIGTTWLIRDTFEEVGPFAYLKPYGDLTDDISGSLQHGIAMFIAPIVFFASVHDIA